MFIGHKNLVAKSEMATNIDATSVEAEGFNLGLAEHPFATMGPSTTPLKSPVS